MQKPQLKKQQYDYIDDESVLSHSPQTMPPPSAPMDNVNPDQYNQQYPVQQQYAQYDQYNQGYQQYANQGYAQDYGNQQYSTQQYANEGYQQYPNQEYSNQQYAVYQEQSRPADGYESKDDRRMTVGTLKSTRRYCCGMFATRRGCFISCGLVVVLILAGIGVAVYFLFPRVSFSNVQAFEPPNGGGLVLSTGSDPATAIQAINNFDPKNPFSATFPIAITVTVKSDSFVTYSFDKISLDSIAIMNPQNASLQVLNSEKSLKASGEIRNPSFPSMKTVNITMPVNVTFVQSVAQITNDNVIQALAGYCSPQLFGQPVTQTASGFVRFQYTVRFQSFITSIVGAFNPSLVSFTQTVNFPCPKSSIDFLSTIVKGAIGR
ncbi:hypothetical protein EDD86DRAFT_206192 [Gorgonomyces haynaldii]|nr:hypothetical protein EDD86DRAFT_206192 [Gorgonomyces haynaldii]